MVPILTFTLSIFFFSNLIASPKESSKELRKKINQLLRDNKETESIPYLEKYLEDHESELYFKMLHAKALLFRNDLELPKPGDDVYTKKEKRRRIRSNFILAARLLEEHVSHYGRVRPRDPLLGRWIFIWGVSEWFSGKKLKAIGLFQKAVKQDYTLTESYYNSAAIYESLGQYKDAEVQWNKYVKAEKELNKPDE